jgi:hypothetical protein
MEDHCYICYDNHDASTIYLPMPDSSYNRVHTKCAEVWAENSLSMLKENLQHEHYIEWYNAVGKRTRNMLDKRSMVQYMVTAKHSFVCKTPDCPFWCEFERYGGCKQTWFRCLMCRILQRLEDHIEYVPNQDGFQNITGYRQCPQCMVVIEKNRGCSLVTCTNCGLDFIFPTYSWERNFETKMDKKDSGIVANLLG